MEFGGLDIHTYVYDRFVDCDEPCDETFEIFDGAGDDGDDESETMLERAANGRPLLRWFTGSISDACKSSFDIIS